MQTSNASRPSPAAASTASGAHADREAIADKLGVFGAGEQDFLRLLMDEPKHDEGLLSGIELFLGRAAAGRFLHTLKLETTGEWLGNSAPARLQIRLIEIAKSSHHPAYQAFRTGVVKSGGLGRAYPKA